MRLCMKTGKKGCSVIELDISVLLSVTVGIEKEMKIGTETQSVRVFNTRWADSNKGQFGTEGWF